MPTDWELRESILAIEVFSDAPTQESRDAPLQGDDIQFYPDGFPELPERLRRA